MAYYTGTQAASATIAADFMATFDPLLISGGFTFIETYTSGTDVTNVYKSPAASNSLALDWYLFVNRASTGGTTVGFGVSEAYNSTTHLATKYAPQGVPATCNVADYTVSDAGVLPSATTSGASLFKSQHTGVGLINTTTTYTYYLNVTPDRVIFGKSTAAGASAQSATYAGIMDPLIDGFNVVISTFSLVNIVSSTTSNSSWGAMTRDYLLPATVSSAVGQLYAWHCQAFNGASGGSSTYYGVPNSFQVTDQIYGAGAFRASRIPIFHSRANTYIPVGLVKDAITHYDTALATTTAGGDTLSITNSSGTYNYVRSDSYALTTGQTTWIPKQ